MYLFIIMIPRSYKASCNMQHVRCSMACSALLPSTSNITPLFLFGIAALWVLCFEFDIRIQQGTTHTDV